MRDFYDHKNHKLVECEWKIILPNGQRTRLHFKDFSLDSSQKCVHSMVSISVLGSVLTFYCSDIPPGHGEVRVKETSVTVNSVLAVTKWKRDSGFNIVFEPV